MKPMKTRKGVSEKTMRRVSDSILKQELARVGPFLNPKLWPDVNSRLILARAAVDIALKQHGKRYTNAKLRLAVKTAMRRMKIVDTKKKPHRRKKVQEFAETALHFLNPRVVLMMASKRRDLLNITGGLERELGSTEKAAHFLKQVFDISYEILMTELRAERGEQK